MFYYLQDKPLRNVIPEIGKKFKDEESQLTSSINHLYRTVLDYIPAVVCAIVVLIFGLWVINRIARLAERSMHRRSIDVSLRSFLGSLISIGLKIILIVTVAGMLGIGTASFVTILGAAGLAIGLALQGSLSNFAGGVLILIFKPFRVGDTIQASDQTGEVLEIQIFNTILLTSDNKTVILPNGPLSNGTIVNITRHGTLRANLSFTVSSSNDLSWVIDLIKDELSKNGSILPDPAPSISISKIESNSVTLSVQPFTKTEHSGSVTFSLYMAIKRRFEAEKVKAPVAESIVRSMPA